MNGLGCQQSNPSYSTRNRVTRGGFNVFKQVGSQEPASVQFTMALNTVLISLVVTHSGGTFTEFSQTFFYTLLQVFVWPAILFYLAIRKEMRLNWIYPCKIVPRYRYKITQGES